MRDHRSRRPPINALTAAFAGRTVSRIGYGAAQLDRLHDRPGEAAALLRRAIELGVDHVDTATFYGFGFANAVIREALRPDDEVLVVTKVAVTAKLCTPQGLALATIPRRDKTAFARARKLDWGDAVIDSGGSHAE